MFVMQNTPESKKLSDDTPFERKFGLCRSEDAPWFPMDIPLTGLLRPPSSMPPCWDTSFHSACSSEGVIPLTHEFKHMILEFR